MGRLPTKTCPVVAKFTASNLSIQLVPAHITDCSKCSINAHLHSSLIVDGTSWGRPTAGITKSKLSIVATRGRCWSTWSCRVENIVLALLNTSLTDVSDNYYTCIANKHAIKYIKMLSIVTTWNSWQRNVDSRKHTSINHFKLHIPDWCQWMASSLWLIETLCRIEG